jgi:hypothetical protein
MSHHTRISSSFFFIHRSWLTAITPQIIHQNL